MNVADPGELTEADLHWLRQAIELSRRCPPSSTAFSVGALIVDADGTVVADGWSRRDDPHEHAEEAALARVGTVAGAATIYSSLEPCSARASRPRSCTELILAAGLRRVVFAWREPEIFVDCDGAERLRDAGATVIEVPSLAPLVRKVNAHLASCR
ncbi:dCMP deaminase [Cryptosporangium aurantiacum]|uniref:Diaminohydroxyphosphoribosylaminopyrimidine deaminase n=1 Tax=Cryptosporangium aurantiacum TaxID=134849 RepID=A0A1M7MPS1_9ACTN|nr:dCMP deaminase [Cryptosporangium aurantiacum]SHM92502.1 diaminohydroxyphosphoribosylaminopyrimidine deaminase [Cryptosporangium aurantiacum]